MYFLGFDLGSSFIKASIVDAESQKTIATATVPDREMGMMAQHPGWAEQSPDQWWSDIKILTKKVIAISGINGQDIRAIGISYQMHGLVLVDKNGDVLRPSIIWCDSRAVHIGDKAFDTLGHAYCLQHLLNSPGNFTASKLRWVIENEPAVAEKIASFMLPGDFINFKLTGEINSSISALSEGIFWDFKNQTISNTLLQHYGIDIHWTPQLRPVFSQHGLVRSDIASDLGLKAGIPVSYSAGDQPNNAFSLNVLQPGEIAATAGTSGVVYGVQDNLNTDPLSRVNAFAHVNHSNESPRIGTLLCVNGTGIANSWFKKMFSTGAEVSYESLNALAANSVIGSNGIQFFPFGNGAERMLGNKMIQSHIKGIDFNRHTASDLVRSIQEGIVFALNYGTEIMKANGLQPKAIKAGKANMFLSPVFRKLFSSLINVPLEFYDTDGATGAARGAGIGAGYYTLKDAFLHLHKIEEIYPDPAQTTVLQEIYTSWKSQLDSLIK